MFIFEQLLIFINNYKGNDFFKVVEFLKAAKLPYNNAWWDVNYSWTLKELTTFTEKFIIPMK